MGTTLGERLLSNCSRLHHNSNITQQRGDDGTNKQTPHLLHYFRRSLARHRYAAHNGDNRRDNLLSST